MGAQLPDRECATNEDIEVVAASVDSTGRLSGWTAPILLEVSPCGCSASSTHSGRGWLVLGLALTLGVRRRRG